MIYHNKKKIKELTPLEMTMDISYTSLKHEILSHSLAHKYLRHTNHENLSHKMLNRFELSSVDWTTREIQLG